MSDIYSFNVQENELIETIKNAYYMQPVISKIDAILAIQDVEIYQNAFNYLYEVIQGSKDEVEKIIKQRKLQGLIKDEKQTAKAVVGNIFPYAVIYIFLKNKEIKNIDQRIYITNKKSAVRGFENISTIKLGDGEQQKPDCDLIIYSYHTSANISDGNNQEIPYPKCIILSLKTSLRERASQTYKWKLLLEIANDHGSKIKEKYGINYNVPEIPLIKYGINYNVPEIPLICFVTVNFYNEINNPQQRGMLKFFDKAFLAKKLDNEKETDLNRQKSQDFISPLSELVDFVRDFFKL